MSKYKYNEVTLPGLPDSVFPHAVIVQGKGEEADYFKFFLMFSNTAYTAVDVDGTYAIALPPETPISYYLYIRGDEGWEWEYQGSTTLEDDSTQTNDHLWTYINPTKADYIWCNEDIKNTSEQVIFEGSEPVLVEDDPEEPEVTETRDLRSYCLGIALELMKKALPIKVNAPTPGGPDTGKIEKIVMYVTGPDTYNADDAEWTLNKVTGGVEVSMAAGKPGSVSSSLNCHLLALTTNGYVVHISDADKDFSATWDVNVLIGTADYFSAATVPPYNERLDYYGEAYGESGLTGSYVPELPDNISAVRYLYNASWVATGNAQKPCNFSIKVPSVTINNISYVPEVFTYADMRNWLGTYNATDKTIALSNTIKASMWDSMLTPNRSSRNDWNPVVYHFDSNGSAVSREEYTKITLTSSFIDKCMVLGQPIVIFSGDVECNEYDIHEYRSNISVDTGYGIDGVKTVCFRNPENESVDFAEMFFGSTDNFYEFDGYCCGVKVYTDNKNIHDRLVADYGHLDTQLFSIHRLDGSEWVAAASEPVPVYE